MGQPVAQAPLPSPAPLNCTLAVTNFQAATSAAKLVNFTPLRECDIVVISEPGDVDRRQSQVTNFIKNRYVEFTARRAQQGLNDSQHRGGVTILGRKDANWTFDVAATPQNFQKMEARAVKVSRNGSAAFIVIGMYLSPNASNDDAVSYVLSCIDGAKNAHPDTPVLVAGDLNARMQAAGDTQTCPRGRKLAQALLEREYYGVAAPSRGDACLDVILAPAGVRLSQPTRHRMKFTDHDHAVVSTIEPSPKSNQFKWRRVLPSNYNEETFLHTLECQLLRNSGGTPFGQEHHISAALDAAYLAVGAQWRLTRIRHTVPDVDDIVAAANRNAWEAVRMLRPSTTQVPEEMKAETLLKAFGKEGMQKTHGNPELSRRPTPVHQFAPVSAAEVREAIARHNKAGCADPDGITPKILQLASRCSLFCERLADLITKCMETARVPPKWRDSTIIPIYKANKPIDDAKSFRPVNLTSILGRTADRVVDARLKAQWRPHSEQYGFRKGVPINVVPYGIFGECCKAIQRGGRALLVAVDIQGAFPETAVAAVMDGYPRVAPEIRGFKSAMLVGRRIRVYKHASDKTRYEGVVDGTSQGHVSGPTDFSATTTELLDRLDVWAASKLSNVGFAMVADDLTLYATGTVANLRILAAEFLNIVAQWARERKLVISPKSKALFIKPRTANNNASERWPEVLDRQKKKQLAPLRCGDVQIQVVQDDASVRILGFHFDGRLTLKKAVDEICDAHNRALMHILPLMPYIDMSERRALYDALAVSHIRRLAPMLVASAHHQEQIEQLDRVLAIGARAITGISSTANRDSTIFEAGFLPVAVMGRQEAVRLAARLSDPDNTTGRLARLARDFFAAGETPRSALTVGVVADAAPVKPEDLRFAAQVKIMEQPLLSPAESKRLRQLVNDRELAEARAIKRRAVMRLLATIPPWAAVVACDGSVWKKRGGAAAALCRPSSWQRAVDDDGDPMTPTEATALAFCMKPAGIGVCSFSAEARGLDGALSLIENAANVGAEDVREFHIVTDSQSMLAALKLGPLRQRDPRLAWAWFRIVQLIKRGLSITLHFGFGHVGWPFGDYVDKLAREASLTGGSDESPQWWVDAAAFNAEIAAMAKSRLGRSIRAQAKMFGPTKWDKVTSRRLHPDGALKLLTQLRTDSCAKIGGHLINQAHRCRRCNAITRRSGVDGSEESMVKHLFVCPWGRTNRRVLRMRGIGTLWSRPFVAIEYVRRFVGGDSEV